MGRKPSRWTNLPKGMRARPRGNLVHYYLDTGARPRKELPLGSDYAQAVKKWAELMGQAPAAHANTEKTFLHAVASYRTHVLPGKATRTRRDNEIELEFLLQFFGDPPAPLASIEPMHVHQYMRWRVKKAKDMAQAKNAERRAQGRAELPVADNLGHVRANREKALFSHIWNHARAEGITSLANPCAGIDGYHEEGRDTVPDDVLVGRVLAQACQPVQFAMRLADIVGQRPADVLRISESHITGDVPGGLLHVRQGKTQNKLRISIEGRLAELVLEIRAYKAEIKRENKVYAMALLVNEKGHPLTMHTLRGRFDDARKAAGVQKDLFQFRDFRAKVATETDEAAGTRAAQDMLGHLTETQTATYIRHKIGKKVVPRK